MIAIDKKMSQNRKVDKYTNIQFRNNEAENWKKKIPFREKKKRKITDVMKTLQNEQSSIQWATDQGNMADVTKSRIPSR